MLELCDDHSYSCATRMMANEIKYGYILFWEWFQHAGMTDQNCEWKDRVNKKTKQDARSSDLANVKKGFAKRVANINHGYSREVSDCIVCSYLSFIGISLSTAVEQWAVVGVCLSAIIISSPLTVCGDCAKKHALRITVRSNYQTLL